MFAFHAGDTQRLLHFNLQVLEQAVGLIESYLDSRSSNYREPIGMHLRHVIEHYEALLHPAEPGVVDYDRRPRDPRVENDPIAALARVQALQRSLAMRTVPELRHALLVRGIGGVNGDFAFDAVSSVARELVFVASHAVHHYALLCRHCEEQGIEVAPAFGRAPATVAYDRHRVTSKPVPRRNSSCASSTPRP